MSVDEAKKRRAPRLPNDAKFVEYDKYIDKQILSTRRSVKVVDFATALVLLASGVLSFLLVAVLVEHWLVPGGFPASVQWLLFSLLVCGISYFAYRRIWPLCVRAINPVYAAQAIEQENPSLKNSLINLLLFRQRRKEIPEAVYQTLEEQAAQRLTRVPIDSAVDRSQLIRFGYLLLAVVAAAGLYKAFSPKDPLVAAERVLMPWADIVPASRVAITSVEPGTVTVTRGEFIDVSAEIRGIDEDDPVVLRYTTADGQAVDKPIAMKPTNSGLRFAGRLPDAAGPSSATGVAKNLTYRIEAGDARTLDYRVNVISAPAMLIERMEYDYPAYTGFVDRSVADLGDIRAIEGTRVTIHARANGTIDEAHVDFDADGRRDLQMSSSGTRATATFELLLRDDRQTPRHPSYVLRFTNAEGRGNRDPVKYPIDVLPDYAPEVAVVSPPEKMLDVRLGDTIVIEVEASDPDFGLAEIRLHGAAAARPAIEVPLLEVPQRRFAGRYRFTPHAHNLREGDIVKYWVTASDIRTPKANTSATDERIFRIVSPDPAKQPPPDRIAQRDPRQQPGGEQGQQGQQNQQGQGGQQGQPQDGEGQQGEKGQQGGENGQQQRGEPSGQGNNQQPQNGKQQGNGGKSGQSEGEPQEGGEAASSGGKNGGEDAPARSDTQDNQSDGKQTGAGTAGGESPQQGSQPAGTRPDQGEKSQGARGNQQNGSRSESQPVSPEGDDDGAAFDRIREHLKQRGELKENESAAQDGNRRQEGESGSADGTDATSGTEKPRTSDSQQPPNRDAQQSEKKREGEQSGERGQQSTEADSAEDNRGRTADQGEGTGADTRQDDVPGQEKPPAEAGEKSKSPGGQQTSTKGPSGAGEQPGENQGVPDSAYGMKPGGEKREQSPSQESKQDDQEPPAPGEGKRESDSQGEMGGDRPGGGQEGGGQKANRDGTGSAGQNQSADEGAGESTEKGAGNNSPNAGQDATADHKTGQTGSDQKGPGSREREGRGNQPGGKAGVEDDPARSKTDDAAHSEKQAEAGDSKSANGERAGNQNRNRPGSGPGAPSGDGGDTGTDAAAPSATEGTAPDGDAANLEYARKQTDLVLERLSDQLSRKRVDERMLKELGWTEDDLRAFVERWQRRKEAARMADPSAEAARRELDDALRSLGLRRGKLQQSKGPEDSQRDLREGYRGPVPAEYQERLRAYNQGISRARQDGE